MFSDLGWATISVIIMCIIGVTSNNSSIEESTTANLCTGKENRHECTNTPHCRWSAGHTILGRFCECDNLSCEHYRGALCANQGICECGRCNCYAGWKGPDCSCPETTRSCVAPGMKEEILCSGHGDCVCGSCYCREINGNRYEGKHCDRCPTCPSRCDELRPCVECQMYGTGKYTVEECAKNCKQFVPEGTVTIIVDLERNELMCEVTEVDDCRYQFTYSYNASNHLQVRVLSKRDCPTSV